MRTDEISDKFKAKMFQIPHSVGEASPIILLKHSLRSRVFTGQISQRLVNSLVTNKKANEENYIFDCLVWHIDPNSVTL